MIKPIPTLEVRPRFVVTIAFPNPEARTNAYNGFDRDEAVRIANFWDERVNTWIHEVKPPTDALSLAMARFDNLIEWTKHA